MGRGEALRYMEEHADELPDGLADSFRALQRTINTQGETNSTLAAQVQLMREEMAEIRGRVEAQPARPGQKPPAAPQSEREKLLASVTPQQRQVLIALMEDAGVVTQEKLKAQQEEQQAEAYTQQGVQEGLERFGERFGHVQPDGTFAWNEDIAEDITSTYQRVVVNEGVSPMDLYVLANWKELLDQARSEGQGTRAVQQRGQKRAQAQTMRNSAPAGRTNVSIYNKERGDTGDMVTDRAVLESLRQLAS